MRTLGFALAQLFVRLRYLVVLGWIAGVAWLAVVLPPISGQPQKSFSALVPPHAPAITAERVSAARFAFPLLARTIIVIRNPHGLPAGRQYQLVLLARALSAHRVTGFGEIAGAVPLLNSAGRRRFARERGTTALLYLYMRSGISSLAATATARRLVDQRLGRPPGEYEGVTGTVPAQGAQSQLINNRLVWVELATILLVAVAVAVHFRAPGAAILAIGAVAAAYVASDRLVAQFGKLAQLTIPAEARPLLIVLVFGVVTDYSIFFLSRFRQLLLAGQDRREATQRVMRGTAPIVATAGLTVAAGTAGLLIATMAFLRGFGPGLAIAVLIAMAVSVTLVPAVIGLAGRWVFWPRAQVSTEAAPQPDGTVRAARRTLAVRFSARHPVLATLLVLALIGGAASGLQRMAVGNELVQGLPASSPIHRSYDEAKRGFAPGVLAPTLVLLTGPGIGHEHGTLTRLQGLIAGQPDVAQVIGPRQSLQRGGADFAVSPSRNAARYAVFLSSDPLGSRAIAAVRRLRIRMPRLMASVGLDGARSRIGGDTAISADIVAGTVRSLWRVIPTVLGAVFVVIAVFLRALVAPAYLVLTSLLAVAATLGLTVYVLQMLFGYGQIAYYVVFTVAVLLVSLGSDYNVFAIGRIWQEGRRRGLRDAVEIGGSAAARPITTAGLVLAASFALLAVVPLRAFREIAFAMGLGLLIDVFVVRTILVPALVTLVGRASAWPGHALRRAAAVSLSETPQRPP